MMLELQTLIRLKDFITQINITKGDTKQQKNAFFMDMFLLFVVENNDRLTAL